MKTLSDCCSLISSCNARYLPAKRFYRYAMPAMYSYRTRYIFSWRRSRTSMIVVPVQACSPVRLWHLKYAYVALQPSSIKYGGRLCAMLTLNCVSCTSDIGKVSSFGYWCCDSARTSWWITSASRSLVVRIHALKRQGLVHESDVRRCILLYAIRATPSCRHWIAGGAVKGCYNHMIYRAIYILSEVLCRHYRALLEELWLHEYHGV